MAQLQLLTDLILTISELEESNIQRMSHTHVRPSAIDAFAKNLSPNARLLRPWNEEYIQVNNPWNAAFDCVTPAFILMAQTEQDVVASVHFCRDNGLIITPRAGRHNLGGFSTVQNGFVIDFREMKKVRVDLDAKTVTIAPGAKNQIVEDYLWKHAAGHAIMGVMDPSIGVYGANLGIGHGHLQRKLGTGTDNIEELKIVLASGKLVTANNKENSDLFYGTKGTHSNMGIVVSLSLRLHQIIDIKQRKEVYHGFMYMDIVFGKEIHDVLNAVLDDKSCPDSLGICYEIIQEANKWVARITWSHYVDFGVFETKESRNKEANKWSQTVKDLMHKYNGTYIVPFCWVTHYDNQTKFVNLPQRLTWYVSAGFVNKQNKDIVYDALCNQFTMKATKECNLCSILMVAYGGVLDKRDLNTSANPAGKGIKWLVMFWSQYKNENDDRNGEIVRQFTRESFNVIKPYLQYGYVNGIAYDQNADYFARFVYGENYDRLTRIKQKYDPTNLFRNNLNIVPKNYYKFGFKQNDINYQKPY